MTQLQQIIICRECPYYKAKCEDGTLFCKMTSDRCEELGQIKGYTQMLDELLKELTNA